MRKFLLLAILAAVTMPARAEEPLDGTRPLDTPLVCLARTLYFEARGQSEAEMAAVAHVVMNRVADPQFPSEICAVISEGGETAPCQFSWWCDGLSDVAHNRAEYRRAVRIAREVLAGHIADPTEGAVMFHNLTVSPAWARSATRSVRIGDQLFHSMDRR